MAQDLFLVVYMGYLFLKDDIRKILFFDFNLPRLLTMNCSKPFIFTCFHVSMLLLLSGCSRVVIKDLAWCADAGIHGAECDYTISHKPFSLDKFQWDKLRLGQICSASENPGESYRNIRDALDKLCADSDRCSPEQREIVDNLKEKLVSAAIKAGLEAL